jgi:hypothetical protein
MTWANWIVLCKSTRRPWMFIVENDTFNLNMYDSISDFGILVVHIKRHHYLIMKRMFKQWWSIIRLTLINRTATSHLKWFNTNNGYDMRRWRQYLAWTCTTSGGVWLFNGIVAFHFDNWISNENTDVNKQLDISIDLRPLIKDAHTITKMNNNINKTYIAKSRSVNARC